MTVGCDLNSDRGERRTVGIYAPVVGSLKTCSQTGSFFSQGCDMILSIGVGIRSNVGEHDAPYVV